MRLKKNIVRLTAFVLCGTAAVACFVGIQSRKQDEAIAIDGFWSDYMSFDWENSSGARYSSYKGTPGQSEDEPYLITTAEELSSIRAFYDRDESIGGLFFGLANEIDLSAHYWVPINLVSRDDSRVSFDGGDYAITGMNIVNSYSNIEFGSDFTTGGERFFGVGATGLFGYVENVDISNMSLVSSSIKLTETSGQVSNIYDYDGEGESSMIFVSDAVGTVVGAATNSTISDTYVDDPVIEYRAVFGVELDEGGSYYFPASINVGGLGGYVGGFGNTVTNSMTMSGAIEVEPVFTEQAEEYYYGSYVSVGGLIGDTFATRVLNTCSSAKVTFSDESYVLASENTGYPRHRVSVGGLIGYSSDEIPKGEECILNSCAHSEISVTTVNIIDWNSVVGGIVGGVDNDNVINNFFDGNITIVRNDDESMVGEIAGYVENFYGGEVLSNYYANGDRAPFGGICHGRDECFYGAEGENEGRAIVITSQEKLMNDLNAGRNLVASAMPGNAGEEEYEQAKSFALLILAELSEAGVEISWADFLAGNYNAREIAEKLIEYEGDYEADIDEVAGEIRMLFNRLRAVLNADSVALSAVATWAFVEGDSIVSCSGRGGVGLDLVRLSGLRVPNTGAHL